MPAHGWEALAAGLVVLADGLNIIAENAPADEATALNRLANRLTFIGDLLAFLLSLPAEKNPSYNHAAAKKGEIRAAERG